MVEAGVSHANAFLKQKQNS